MNYRTSDSSTEPSLPTSLIAVSEAMPPISSPVDANVDLEILRIIPKQFAIVDQTTANWLVRKIIAAREYADRVQQWAEQEKRRADREETTLLFLFGRQIESWAKAEVESLGGRRKSLSLPGGTVGFRAMKPSLHVDDEPVVLIWAKDHCPAAVSTVTTVKLSKSVLKEHFETTGEVPEVGAHVDQGGERFFIR